VPILHAARELHENKIVRPRHFIYTLFYLMRLVLMSTALFTGVYMVELMNSGDPVAFGELYRAFWAREEEVLLATIRAPKARL